MILVIDNYDSFSYNLVQLVGGILQKEPISTTIQIVRNDEITIEDIKKLQVSHIILSPGPGRPKDVGICEKVVLECKADTKILGICLGHQCICEAFHSTISYAKEMLHGKQSRISIDNTDPIFHGLPSNILVGRYHSLGVEKESLNKELQILGETVDGEIMAIKHKDYDMYGLQFHPESVLTKDGETIVRNFLLLGGKI